MSMIYLTASIIMQYIKVFVIVAFLGVASANFLAPKYNSLSSASDGAECRKSSDCASGEYCGVQLIAVTPPEALTGKCTAEDAPVKPARVCETADDCNDGQLCTTITIASGIIQLRKCTTPE